MVRLLGPQDRLLTHDRASSTRSSTCTCAATRSPSSGRRRPRCCRCRGSSSSRSSSRWCATARPRPDRGHAARRASSNGSPGSPAELLSQAILTSRGKSIRPKTLGQKEYVDAIDENTIVFGIGPAGTGKTYLAMAKAVQALQRKEVERIILDPSGGRGGRAARLPAGHAHRQDRPLPAPALRRAQRDDGPELVPKLLAAGTVEVAPLAYMRGRTLNNSFIVLDEAQNTTPEQMKMFLTRLGFGSKMVVTGDITQVDLPGGRARPAARARSALDDIDDIHFARLTSADVVRHTLVGQIVDAYTKYDAEAGEARALRQPRARPSAQETGGADVRSRSTTSRRSRSTRPRSSGSPSTRSTSCTCTRTPSSRSCSSTRPRWSSCTCSGWTSRARPTC